MILHSLSLKNFRNYSSLKFLCHHSSNVFVGHNAQGKSNLLEAIYFLSMLKSFRNNLDQQLVQHQHHSFFIHADFYPNPNPNPNPQNQLLSSITIGLQLPKISSQKIIKKISFNQKPIKKISSVLASFKTILFSQDDSQLILGPPSIRRKFLDQTLSLSSIHYFKTLKLYNKALKQKNILLKSFPKPSPSQISPWNQSLSNLGSELILQRINFIHALNPLIQKLYSLLKFHSNPSIQMIYDNPKFLPTHNSQIKSELENILSLNVHHEILAKQSLFGPHKDHFLIHSHSHTQKLLLLKSFASQGQIRATSLILKLATAFYIQSTTGKIPVLLFDDVLNDLDQQRQHIFLNLIQTHQSFFTTTSLQNLKHIPNSQFYSIHNGSLSPINPSL